MSDWRDLAPALRELKQLCWLDLWNNNLGPEGVAALVPALRELKQLNTLDLRNNNLGPAGATALVPALSKLKQLCTLDLGVNDLGPAGAAALAPALSELKQLNELGLGANNLGPEGAAALVPALSEIEQLNTLYLGGNNLGPAGATALVPALRKLKQLNTLYLWNNNLGPAGAAALVPALRELKQLKTLYLNDNGCLPTELEHVTDAARLRAYLLSDRKTPLREAKLLLLGNGGWGKTHTRRRMMASPGEPDEFYFEPRHLKTLDVALHRWPLVAGQFAGQPTDDTLLRVWDFGGQPNLHGAHRLFLSDERSVYLLVLDADKSLSENWASYWLRYIRHHAEQDFQTRDRTAHMERDAYRPPPLPPDRQPPVILAATKCDLLQRKLESLDEGRLAGLKRDYYANIHGAVEGLGWGHELPKKDWQSFVNSKPHAARHRAALADLRAKIAAAATAAPGADDRFEDAFFEIKRWFEEEFAKDVPSVRRETYEQEICPPSVAPLNRLLYLQVCRSLGLLHFVGDRDDVIVDKDIAGLIFNPEWVKGPAYALLWPQDVRTQGGVLTRRDIDALLPEHDAAADDDSHDAPLWQRLAFTAPDRRHIVQLLKQCELIFPILRGQRETGDYFVPDLLDNAPPSLASAGKPHVLEYEFIPESVFLRFLGHWHDRLKDPDRERLFRDEAVIAEHGVSARIRYDRDAATLSIWHLDGEASAWPQLLGAIKSEFRELRLRREVPVQTHAITPEPHLAETRVSVAPAGPTVDHTEMRILAALLKFGSKRCSIADIRGNFKCDKKTVGTRLANLIALGFVVRPDGPKGGVTLTDNGKKFYESLPPEAK
ncbi:MAG: COR domain-containing protein [Phycisphaerae bacterium]